MPCRTIIKSFLYLSALAVTLWIFWISATFGLFHFKTPKEPSNYALLAEGFLQGQLGLNATPAPELLQVPDPYDPYGRQGAKFIWDASLYDQRYFIYFGPLPALLLYLPSKVLLQRHLTDDAAIFLLTIGALSALAATWILAAKRLLNVSPVGGALPWLLYAAFGTSVSLQLGGGMYVVAALSGMLFQTLTFLLLIQYISTEQPRARTAMLAGATAIAAVASRPTHMLVVIFGGALLVSWKAFRGDTRGLLRAVSAFSFPVAFGGCALALYNYLRFDSVFEFGLSYQLGIADLRQRALCALSNLTENSELLSIQTWYLLLQPPHLQAEFPYVSFRRDSPDDFIPPEVEYLGADAVTGLLWVSPLLIPGLLAAIVYFRRIPLAARLTFLSCGLTAFGALAHLYTCSFAAARYLFEIISALSIIAIPSIWFACTESRTRCARAGWRCLTYLGLAAAIFLGCVGALDGHFEKGGSMRALLRGEDPRALEENPSLLDGPPSPLEAWLGDHVVKHLPVSTPQSE